MSITKERLMELREWFIGRDVKPDYEHIMDITEATVREIHSICDELLALRSSHGMREALEKVGEGESPDYNLKLLEYCADKLTDEAKKYSGMGRVAYMHDAQRLRRLVADFRAALALSPTCEKQDGWVAWKEGDELPPQAMYLVTLDDGFLACRTADNFEINYVIAYDPRPLPPPYVEQGTDV